MKQDISEELKSIYEKNLKSDMPHFGENHQPANYSPFKSLQGSAQKPSGSNIALPPTVAQVGKSGQELQPIGESAEFNTSKVESIQENS